jgi:RNA polymerase sigma-70 factor (ECF subfamily)
MPPARDTGASSRPTEAAAAPQWRGPAVELAQRFHARLVAFAARRVRDPATAEEVAQEALRRVLEALQGGRLRKTDALPAFVFATAKRVCQRILRSSQREQRALARLQAEPVDPGIQPLLGLIRAEERARVRACFARLAPDDRELLAMTFVEGCETPDIAARLGISPGAVRVRRHRALGRLADLLAETNRHERELRK